MLAQSLLATGVQNQEKCLSISCCLKRNFHKKLLNKFWDVKLLEVECFDDQSARDPLEYRIFIYVRLALDAIAWTLTKNNTKNSKLFIKQKRKYQTLIALIE